MKTGTPKARAGARPPQVDYRVLRPDRRIASLDGLRGLALVAVVAYHAAPGAPHRPGPACSHRCPRSRGTTDRRQPMPIAFAVTSCRRCSASPTGTSSAMEARTSRAPEGRRSSVTSGRWPSRFSSTSCARSSWGGWPAAGCARRCRRSSRHRRVGDIHGSPLPEPQPLTCLLRHRYQVHALLAGCLLALVLARATPTPSRSRSRWPRGSRPPVARCPGGHGLRGRRACAAHLPKRAPRCRGGHRGDHRRRGQARPAGHPAWPLRAAMALRALVRHLPVALAPGRAASAGHPGRLARAGHGRGDHPGCSSAGRIVQALRRTARAPWPAQQPHDAGAADGGGRRWAAPQPWSWPSCW